jgi:serine/threonine-protein kinase
LLAGRYRLDDLIASGGMAQVWQATDEVLRRQVAVKLLHAHLAADDTFQARFRHEAVAAARLAHPSIVAIYDTCSEGDTEAIVMELVRGPTLRDRLDEGGVDPWQAAGIAAQVADALAVAHKAGLVHRDIKPANILLCDDGRVKVADFGIAKAAEGADLTHEGLMVGTAKYLAPEQVRGGAIDARTDLYGLGVVLYEMLCGRPPFNEATDAATALARLHSDPMRPRQVRAGVPRSLEAIALRALAREPDARYQSAADMRAALVAADDMGIAAGADATYADTGYATTPAAPPASAPAGPTPRFTQTERAWLVPTLLVVLVAVSLGVVGLLWSGSGAGDLLGDLGDALGGGSSTPAALVVAEARAFDPEGRPPGDENNDLAPNVRDADPATAWRTERYNDPDLTALKPGVGIWVRVEGRGTSLDVLEVDSPTARWRAEVYVAPAPAGDLAGWGAPVATVDGAKAGTTRISLGGAEGSAVLLWLTHVGDGNRTEISELRVLG